MHNSHILHVHIEYMHKYHAPPTKCHRLDNYIQYATPPDTPPAQPLPLATVCHPKHHRQHTPPPPPPVNFDPALTLGLHYIYLLSLPCLIVLPPGLIPNPPAMVSRHLVTSALHYHSLTRDSALLQSGYASARTSVHNLIPTDNFIPGTVSAPPLQVSSSRRVVPARLQPLPPPA